MRRAQWVQLRDDGPEFGEDQFELIAWDEDDRDADDYENVVSVRYSRAGLEVLRDEIGRLLEADAGGPAVTVADEV